jgi:membrane protein required for beta-lactamase induction
MSTQHLILLLVVIGLAVFGILVYLATLGYGFAFLLLGALGTLFLISVGLVYNLIANKIQADSQQQAFMDNAKENLSIMSALQGIQNKQNQTIMSQLGRVARLPEPSQPMGLDFDDIIFEELEQ